MRLTIQLFGKSAAICGLAAAATLMLGQSDSALGAFEAHADVGNTPEAGDALYDAGTKTYRVTGGGANMWLKEDAFQFVYKRVPGDISLAADVAFEGKGTEPHRKLALMIRQSLDPDSAYGDIATHGDGLTALQYRPSAGVDTSEFRLAMKAPTSIGIERRGHEITVWASDGIDTATNGPVVVSMSGPVYVGLAVCSHNAGVLETAVFKKVRWGNGKSLSRVKSAAGLLPRRLHPRSSDVLLSQPAVAMLAQPAEERFQPDF